MSVRIGADDDILVEDALEVAGEPVQNAIVLDAELFHIIPFEHVYIISQLASSQHCT